MGEAQLGQAGDEHDIVAPRAEREMKACHLTNLTRPRARGVDYDGGGEAALGGGHARHFPGLDIDPVDLAILHEDGSARFGRVHERGRG